MEYQNIQKLKMFTLDTIPDLDVVVLGALELFEKEPLPKLNMNLYKRPLVVGSGNAEATGRIIFDDTDAVFASESNFESKLKHIPDIDGVVLISASGGKHAPIIAKRANELGKRVTLVTNNSDAPAKEFVKNESVFVFPKNREPYTYNTSTYMGMILGKTQEDPKSIQQFIQERIGALSFPDFSRYNKYFLIVPTRFFGIIRMLEVKFIELFGREIARDVETSEYMKHAVTVVPSNELFVSFGEENIMWGDPGRRLHIPLPENADYGAMMAIGYYVIGQIQKKHPPYFKKNIVAYTEEASRIFGGAIHPIVE
ncbi:MAG: hypothetical protein COZ49_02970 [Candidatus Yonathbacteria bacterium CG_4_10_14_3_um_filter_47_65]|uniref:SIS domain-containing protein n=2 Tax=Parcubacteria group TaxID=1794811 RepID=A0A2M8D6M7_9BACT|nr:MAG: hypothetical protein AUJ44_04380 [Candidatus Nomurabacteria bacterium CG1_02_47_685]PIP03659.1 MAG: hypothetical protein COX54_02705 [Candidatus Yonathbacteria bacterium CG23_combo_of_CG06-09_8_20_14_all_46_18]PIQ31713.1 MAG: hypothetical protein COW61_03260 [Candidatus Yonathbacteria bacterium CG17_big_fil_post_rev_8_21_14_2_50_46_19]PIX56289.1 MAG: hypothetical protein COZ49_02970 [Candidatus Yonathbacteria bacterium CG_4_10_14_3_um_filter_47_65]PIY57951.1 MAG: hypothetical protein CO